VATAPVPSADLEDLRISLRRDLPVQSGPSLFARPDINVNYSLPRPDGSFVVEATPGDLQISVAPLLNLTSRANVNLPVPASLQHAYVKSVRLGDVDVLNSGLRLQGPVAGTLEIVIGTTPGAFEGTVLAGGSPAGPGVTVALLPDVRRRIDLYKTTTTDPAGRFHMDRVPPSSYRAFAWQDVNDGAWHDPEFMQANEARGAAVAIGEGRTTNVRLDVIPPPVIRQNNSRREQSGALDRRQRRVGIGARQRYHRFSAASTRRRSRILRAVARARRLVGRVLLGPDVRFIHARPMHCSACRRNEIDRASPLAEPRPCYSQTRNEDLMNSTRRMRLAFAAVALATARSVR
jgi:hypothetical protein